MHTHTDTFFLSLSLSLSFFLRHICTPFTGWVNVLNTYSLTHPAHPHQAHTHRHTQTHTDTHTHRHTHTDTHTQIHTCTLRWADASSDTVTGSEEPQWAGDWNGISLRYGWLQSNTKADLIRELIVLI